MAFTAPKVSPASNERAALTSSEPSYFRNGRGCVGVSLCFWVTARSWLRFGGLRRRINSYEGTMFAANKDPEVKNQSRMGVCGIVNVKSQVACSSPFRAS